MWAVYYKTGRNIQDRGIVADEWLIILAALHIFILIVDLDINYIFRLSLFLFLHSILQRKRKRGADPFDLNSVPYYNFNKPAFHQPINRPPREIDGKGKRNKREK